LHFISFSGTLRRQFELLQQSWIMHPTLAELYNDADPIVGNPAVGIESQETITFTEQAQPLRKKVYGIPQFTFMKGGAYFFMPGIKGLQYLSKMKPPQGE
jgi:hypothetical protein